MVLQLARLTATCFPEESRALPGSSATKSNAQHTFEHQHVQTGSGVDVWDEQHQYPKEICARVFSLRKIQIDQGHETSDSPASPC